MTFLEQLQESAGLLNNKIKDTDTTQIKSLFGNYNPNLASDYVATPFGQPIAQNRFLGNQFQMPNLSGQTYTPGAMAPGAGYSSKEAKTVVEQGIEDYAKILRKAQYQIIKDWMRKAKSGVIDYFDISRGVRGGDVTRAYQYEVDFLAEMLHKTKIIDRFRKYFGGRKGKKR